MYYTKVGVEEGKYQNESRNIQELRGFDFIHHRISLREGTDSILFYIHATAGREMNVNSFLHELHFFLIYIYAVIS